MKPANLSRLAEVVVATVIVLAVLAWVERTARLHLDQLRREVDEPALALASLVHESRAEVLELRLASLEGAERPDPDRLHRLQDLAARIERGAKQSPGPGSNVELEAWGDRFRTSLTHYLEAVQAQASVGATEPLLAELVTVCEGWRQAAASAGPDRISTPGRALDALQRVWFLSLILVALAGAVLVAVFYRGLLTPLRVQLSESQTHLERHEKLASLGVLAAGIAHEIRNPLTAIKVRLFSLKRSAPELASVQEDAQVISQEIHRLERIVGDFLQFARSPELARQPLRVGSLIEPIERLLGPPLAGRSVRLILEPSPELWVCADPEKLKQVLINLVQNAAQSIAHEGRVTLRVVPARQELLGRPTDVVRIEVADTGAGMPPEVVRRLFDPFFTTKDDGTGLGLPIAARIVELHGGVIEYETQLQRGTTFTIVLPRVTPDEATTPNSAD